MSHAASAIGNPDTVPALAAPEGQVSNLDNPYSLKSYIYGTAAVTITLSTVAVALRVYVKARVLRRAQIEEYILILSLIGFYFFSGFMIYAAHLGQGTHQWNVSVANFQEVVQWANIIEIVYCPTILGAKVAMLLQLKRIFLGVTRGKLYWLHEVLLWTNIPCYLAIMFSFAFACVPREKIWEPHLPGRCISVNGLLIGSSVLNVVSDITILLLPLVVIIRLQLPARSKMILAAVFGTGILGCIASIFRLVYGILLTQTHDFTWGIAPIGLWALGEICSAILSGAIPMLPGFVKFVRDRNASSNRDGSSANNASGSRRAKRSRNTNTKNTESEAQIITLPGRDNEDNKGMHEHYYEMGVMDDAHGSVSALIDHDGGDHGRGGGDGNGNGIMRTVHIRTEYVKA
ncbi:hypothetical protein ASPCAL01572 [Aspergillus calidoustus]|uniref:Rhodopsin domain-containing protein n=1 Tax=Aspergillus calidoustus TaxID=454130 RepID=A0A0U5C360_ASPCI|nr:hypothetical protein ASPCAL01572 [Aspergillus calidoustus]